MTEQISNAGLPDLHKRAWRNECMYCATSNYTPAGPELWHYCVNCVIRCKICDLLKPLFGYPYDFESDGYREWRKVCRLPGKSRAPITACLDTCHNCHSYVRQESEKEKMARLKKEAQARSEARKELLNSPQMNLMLKALKNS